MRVNDLDLGQLLQAGMKFSVAVVASVFIWVCCRASAPLVP